jgi:mannosyl-oligosaccharide alpha-1,2-mannosidase
MLLGGLSQQPRKLYESALEAAKKELFFRPMTKGNHDILISGNTRATGADQYELDPQFQHLVCFVGGMMGIASRIFKQPDDLVTARKLTDGCIWAYKAMPSGMMPEVFHVVPCANASDCEWDERKWREGIMARNEGVNEADIEEKIKELRLVEGFTYISDKRYILRYVLPLLEFCRKADFNDLDLRQ